MRGLTARNRLWLPPMCMYSVEAQDGVVELARVWTARPRLQLLAVEGVKVEVAVDDDVGVSAPA